MTPSRCRIYCLAMFVLVTTVVAGPAQNEPGAVLVFPAVMTETAPGSGATAETLLSVTNLSASDVVLHWAFIDGDPGLTECYECDFQSQLPGRGTATLVVRDGGGFTVFENLEQTLFFACPFTRGFVLVHLENLDGDVIYEDVLIGKQLVTDPANGKSFATSAIPFQGAGPGGDGDRELEFDGNELVRMPRIVALEFHAPNGPQVAPPAFDAFVTLFTLDFERQSPPRTECGLSGYDADGALFSESIDFGCWTQLELGDISPEFEFPDLGIDGGDEHGWMLINCQVDRDDDAVFDSDGAVHGALFQYAPPTTVLRGNDGGPATSSASAWGRALVQSVTDGDPAILQLESTPVPP